MNVYIKVGASNLAEVVQEGCSGVKDKPWSSAPWNWPSCGLCFQSLNQNGRISYHVNAPFFMRWKIWGTGGLHLLVFFPAVFCWEAEFAACVLRPFLSFHQGQHLCGSWMLIFSHQPLGCQSRWDCCSEWSLGRMTTELLLPWMKTWERSRRSSSSWFWVVAGLS